MASGHHVAALGAALGGGGLGLMVVGAFGWLTRKLPDPQILASSTPAERRGVPFANRAYYAARFGPRIVGVGLVLFVADGILVPDCRRIAAQTQQPLVETMQQ